MTNENAINVLRHLSLPHTNKAAFDAFRQAIAIAIEALEEPQIIRCKECKHYDPIYAHNEGVCEHWGAKTKEDIYCGYAERKEDIGQEKMILNVGDWFWEYNNGVGYKRKVHSTDYVEYFWKGYGTRAFFTKEELLAVYPMATICE